MPSHKYKKSYLIEKFDEILGKSLEEVDEINFFEDVEEYALQKGVVGSLIEQGVLRYPPDTRQEADLIVVDEDKEIKTELKTTGMLVSLSPKKHYIAKEPMSITAVGIYNLAEQIFEESHFWAKLEHMLIIYYQYMSNHPVRPVEYRTFPIRGYEFHEFSEIEKEGLKHDWENVKSLVTEVVSNHIGVHDAEWKKQVRQEYIEKHGRLRKILNYIDLAPKFPPRFRLKKPIVSNMIAQHFGYDLEQLPGRYVTFDDIDRKCKELKKKYFGKKISELVSEFGITKIKKKNLAESIIVSMFGGTKKINQIEMFKRFGIIAKSITISTKGKRTEDMKLFRVDFEEFVRTEIVDDSAEIRPIIFEDSEIYSYFTDYEFLCILFQETDNDDNNAKNTLLNNKFIGFKRLVFSDEFIYGPVKKLWEDTRDKIINHKLEDVIDFDKKGIPKINKNGITKSAPNFMKSKENVVFIRGGGVDSSHKTEMVNGIKMLPQHVWIKGAAVVKELDISLDDIKSL